MRYGSVALLRAKESAREMTTSLHSITGNTLEAPTDDGSGTRPAPRRLSGPVLAASRTHPWWPWLVLGVGLTSFCYGATTLRSAAGTQWGLLAAASPAYGASILLTVVGFAVAIRRANFSAAVAATVLMIVVQRLPRALVTDYPMYAWTYKHLGVVDYLQHSHSLARGVDVYHGWPGLFALTAWFCDLTGVDPVSIAHWFTVCFHVGFALIVYAAARAWTLAPTAAITATFLVATLNWVEQDYYSPQAVTMLFTAGIVALVGLSRDRPVGTWLLVVAFATATITHQLTPFWTLLVIGALAATGKLKPWWIVFPLAILLFGILLYNWNEVSGYGLLSFDVVDNSKSNIPAVGTPGQELTSLGVRMLSGSMWFTTAVVLLIRWRRKQPFWALGVLAMSPMVILGGQGYGNEAIFRVFLYSLIGCSIVLAPVFVAGLQRGIPTFVGALLVLSVVTGLSAQGNTGSWFANIMPTEQVEGAKRLLEQAEFPSYITAIAPVWPERSSWRYVDFARFDKGFDGSMIDVSDLVLMDFSTDADYQRFRYTVAQRSNASTYLLFTEQARLYTWYYGVMPLDALPNLEGRIKNDPEWQLVYDDQGISVYLHRVVVS
ncbi:hypothetical protein E4P42_06005 [Mycobacterium sp. PS03-16]|uniref:hypothetical protein n=1 Tax=Mycobacterium sp. PS03-16 TaxID=2559611 RepID=UPI0010748E06|nr:hypothetical protein [Mycobacterium sp. PS03-16]TFV59926.1 hypothetical protein E4P42_06005 [Mycobacterium sp. PS03-16]